MEIVKIILVYNMDYLIELEVKLDEALKRKQQFLEEYSFKENDPAYIDLITEIEHIDHRIHHFECKCSQDPNYFAGIAFI